MIHSDIQVVAPNLKKRWSGVTSTIFRLLPIQQEKIAIVSVGPNLPSELPSVPLREIFSLDTRTRRVWHARRNNEMLLGLFLKKLLRKNMALVFTSAAQRHHSRYTRWLIRQMDHVIATSQKSASYLQVPNQVIMHGIDSILFHPAVNKTELRDKLGLPAGKLVGCFGRVRPQKGVDLFVEAMITACNVDPQAVGVICGQTTREHAEFTAMLKKRIADANLSDRILLLGEQPNERLGSLFRALDIYVAPQRWEGFGLTPLEAMASGLPVIATTAGAFEEMIVDGDTGHIVALNRVDAIEAPLLALLANDAARKRMGDLARQRILERFDICSEADNLIDVYQKLLKTD